MTWQEIVENACNRIEKVKSKFNRKKFSEWMMTKEKYGYLFDPFVYYKCYVIRNKLKDDYDYLIGICGFEGWGKSRLSMQMACIISDDSFDSRGMCMDADEFISWLNIVPDESVIVADEGAYFLFARESSTKLNTLVVKLLTIIRQKRLCIIVNAVNFFILDTYLRMHRISSLIQLTKRGKLRQISKKGIDIINNKAWKTKNVMGIRMPTECFRDGYFNDKVPNGFNIENYNTKKTAHRNRAIKEAMAMVRAKQQVNNNELIPSVSFLKDIGRTGIYVKNKEKYLNSLGLEPVKIGQRWYINKEKAYNLKHKDKGVGL